VKISFANRISERKKQILKRGSSWNLVAGCEKTRDSLSFWDERINNRTLSSFIGS